MGDWHTLTTGPPTSGGSPDMLVLSMNSKRQRRPSVRLGEIGDQSAALTQETYMKRKEKWDEKQWRGVQEDPKGSLLQQPCGFSKQSTDFVVSSAVGSGRVSKTRPIGNPVSENHHGQPDTAIEIQSQEDPNPLPRTGGIPEEQGVVVSEGVVNATSKKIQLDLRGASKKGRHGKRRRGVSRGSTAVGKLTKSIRVSPEGNDENEKGSGEDGFGEPLSNASYDIYTPEGFRDSDLETSESPGYIKETSVGVQVPSSDARIISLGPSHGQQLVKELYQNERDEFISEQRGQGKLGETWVATNTEGHILSILDRSVLDLPPSTSTRSKQDANGILIRELKVETDEKTIPINARHGGGLANGVKTWLNGLGLGRYAQIFEMHEVDMEVLHLLTLDDLREMGINAVGSRRKMYASIQQLGKGFMV